MHGGNRPENIVGLGFKLAQLLELVGEHVKQHFGIRIGVQMTQVGAENFGAQLGGIGQVAVMCQGYTVGRIDVKGLGQCSTGTALGGVANMAKAKGAEQLGHVLAAKDVPDQALPLALQEFALLAGHDSRRVLAPVLEHGQRVIDFRRDIPITDYSHQSTHRFISESDHVRRLEGFLDLLHGFSLKNFRGLGAQPLRNFINTGHQLGSVQ